MREQIITTVLSAVLCDVYMGFPFGCPLTEVKKQRKSLVRKPSKCPQQLTGMNKYRLCMGVYKRDILKADVRRAVRLRVSV